VEVGADEVIAFLDPLPVSRLWGVGRVGEEKLHRLGLRTIGQVRVADLEQLRRTLGGWGEHLWRLANGIDARRVVPDHVAKQISHERTFHEDLTDETMLRGVVSYLTEQVARRLRRNGRRAKGVSIKYRRDDFRTFTRAVTLDQPTDSTDAIFRAAESLLMQMRASEPRPVRLIGVSATPLTGKDAPQQLSLFDLTEGETPQREIDKVVDQLRDRIGDAAVYRATSHSWIHRKNDSKS
jgi:DNA polymerase-4